MAGGAGQHAERHRPARLDGDAPEHELADALDRAAHVVGFAGRNAAGGEHQVVMQRGLVDGAREGGLLVGENAEIGDDGAQPLEQFDQQEAVGIVNGGGAARRARLDHLVAVEKIATFSRRRTASSVRPSAAASAMCCASSTVPAGITTRPLDTSSPASLRLAPRCKPLGTTMRSPSTFTSSCMKTVSAPLGMAAPVKILIACPA